MVQLISQAAVGLGGDFETLDDLADCASIPVTAFPRHLKTAFVKGVKA